MAAASTSERTIAELGLIEASRSNLESLPSQGLPLYMVLGNTGDIHTRRLQASAICLGIEQPPSRRSAAEALLKMRCPPSGSFSLDRSSSGRSTESSRRAPCSWDIGGNCVSGAGNLIIEIADGN